LIQELCIEEGQFMRAFSNLSLIAQGCGLKILRRPRGAILPQQSQELCIGEGLIPRAFLNLRVIAWRYRLENLRRPTEQVFPNIKFFTQKMLPQLGSNLCSVCERSLHLMKGSFMQGGALTLQCFTSYLIILLWYEFGGRLVWFSNFKLLNWWFMNLAFGRRLKCFLIKMLSWLMHLEIINLF
jgi:hypothetical protein